MVTDHFTAPEPSRRLDLLLAEHYPGKSRSRLAALIRSGFVTLNGKPAKPGSRVEKGDRVTVTFPPPEPTTLEREEGELVILHRDEDLLVIDKPAGISVHPGAGRTTGTIVNRLLALGSPLSVIGGVERPGIVHRLDRETSGVLLIALNDAAHVALSTDFRERRIHKEYLAVVRGRVPFDETTVDAPIGRHPRQRKRMAVTSAEKGREAITEFTVEAYYGTTTLVAAHPLTGRTHQIRVHFASIGHPMVGDVVYGPRRDAYKLGRHFLHAHRLHFLRPADDASLDLVSPLPPDLQALLDRLSPK